ncbi:phosphatases II [Guyanagaster necrorhizus]|uniref:Phosphatases II n=1 Tax=Guyanagaster necrorhizus TaxID=856835 RepID=A0A9P8ASH2_9AGAR|nr:phosphatases II [Guyanagaster necrorhizus MCA 3950]KAG7446403.1 phosphatases II [Guyanagaster necrorhizus MCA 3950]
MTLVESAAFPYPHQLVEGIERLHCMPTDVPTVPRFVEDTIQVVTRLASQHHASDYSRIKFGPRGCSTRYVPLCIHTPDVYRELRLHQKECNQKNPWWYGEFQGTKSVSNCKLSESQLVQELSAAMEEPLDVPCIAPAAPSEISIQQHIIKTSMTHPINISSIIPLEFLALISSHLLLTACPPTCICHAIPEHSRSCRMRSTICEITSSFSLDRLVFSGCQSEDGPSIPPDPPAHTPSKVLDQPTSHVRTRSHMSQALQAAINSGFSTSIPTTPPTADASLSSFLRFDKFSDISQSTSATLNSNHSSVSLSLSLRLSTSSLPMSSKRSHQTLRRTLSVSEQGERECRSTPDLLANGSSVLPPVVSPFTLGNLLLSSCPGKKVRLQGPVRGRSGVCRNLETDLLRMKELGVGCIVCCLDDSELEFLGARWPDYERLTRQIGVVGRLPTPEGLAPSLSASSLNEHLTVLIHTYTLRGIPVLVHCRGGVGRAGVVACCWMIRLGLCGWFTDANRSSFHSMVPSWLSGDSYHGLNSYIFPVRCDTLEMVETAICIVRRRRSVKAVETYEQVKFLVDFVEYLRESV